MNLRLGLLINFDEYLLKDGLSRIVNGLTDTQITPISLDNFRAS